MFFKSRRNIASETSISSKACLMATTLSIYCDWSLNRSTLTLTTLKSPYTMIGRFQIDLYHVTLRIEALRLVERVTDCDWCKVLTKFRTVYSCTFNNCVVKNAIFFDCFYFPHFKVSLTPADSFTCGHFLL